MRAPLLFIFAILVAFQVGYATTPDPIDHLVADLSTSHDNWENGVFPNLGMPKTALPEAVIKRIFEKDRVGYVPSYKILKIRPVLVQGSVYTAALVQMSFGEEIILFKYLEKAGWWSRVFVVKIY